MDSEHVKELARTVVAFLDAAADAPRDERVEVARVVIQSTIGAVDA